MVIDFLRLCKVKSWIGPSFHAVLAALLCYSHMRKTVAGDHNTIKIIATMWNELAILLPLKCLLQTWGPGQQLKLSVSSTRNVWNRFSACLPGSSTASRLFYITFSFLHCQTQMQTSLLWSNHLLVYHLWVNQSSFRVLNALMLFFISDSHLRNPLPPITSSSWLLRAPSKPRSSSSMWLWISLL